MELVETTAYGTVAVTVVELTGMTGVEVVQIVVMYGT